MIIIKMFRCKEVIKYIYRYVLLCTRKKTEKGLLDMPKPGWKCININEEYYEAIELLAEKKKRSIKSIVVEALEDKYPMTFEKVSMK